MSYTRPVILLFENILQHVALGDALDSAGIDCVIHSALDQAKARSLLESVSDVGASPVLVMETGEDTSQTQRFLSLLAKTPQLQRTQVVAVHPEACIAPIHPLVIAEFSKFALASDRAAMESLIRIIGDPVLAPRASVPVFTLPPIAGSFASLPAVNPRATGLSPLPEAPSVPEIPVALSVPPVTSFTAQTRRSTIRGESDAPIPLVPKQH